MNYLDNAATTLRKPPSVLRAVEQAMKRCANPGRGGHAAAMRAAEEVYQTRSLSAALFECEPEQVCFSSNATEGLNAAIRTLVRSGDRVVISSLEHNAVTRTLAGLGAEADPAVPRSIFRAEDWMNAFEDALRKPAAAVVCMHVSNVFGCRLPVDELSRFCREKRVPLIVDASQSAGVLPVSLRRWDAAFIAMPGHKALFGPQGTGLLLCGAEPKVYRYGGTGSQSLLQTMPEQTPERMEAGTLNVPGICGLGAGISFIRKIGLDRIERHDARLTRFAAQSLRELGVRVFDGPGQTGVLSFLVPGEEPELTAAWFAEKNTALRAGLHCAPLAHRTLGTLPLGTVRLSVSALTEEREVLSFLELTRLHLTAKKQRKRAVNTKNRD